MGEKVTIAVTGVQAVVLMDSIAYADASDAGKIVVAGSHGGRSSGRFAIEHPLAACFLNDAGIGKDDAGIASLAMLDRLGRAGATYDFQSARIGNARDAWEHGVISRVNRAAAGLGCAAGEKLAEAVRRLNAAPLLQVTGTAQTHEPDQRVEASGINRKTRLQVGPHEAILMDSTACAEAGDAGHIIVAGSHGGLAGKYGGDIRVTAIFLNDAGGGKELAGIASLAEFDRIEVPAAAYGHRSARIGDAQDAWDEGVITFVNRTAVARGFITGEPVKAAIHRVFGGTGR